jgi:hypothetical protein
MPKSNVVPWVLFGLSCIVTIWAVAIVISVSLGQPSRAQAVGDYYSDAEAYTSPTEQRGTQNHPLIVRLEQTQEQKDAAERAERQADNNASFARTQTYFNGILALCAVATIWVIAKQVSINKGQLATQRAELRAYVGYTIQFDWPQAGVPYPISFKCTNHGKTPALQIGFRGGIWHLTRPLNMLGGSTLPAIAPGWDEGRMDLFPGDENSRTIHSNSQSAFTGEHLSQVVDETHVFVVGLKIRYKDMFGDWHETQEYTALGMFSGKPAAFVIPGGSQLT